MDDAGLRSGYPRRVSFPSPDDGNKPSPARIGIWLVVSAVGVFMLVSGIIAIVSGGN